MGKPKVTQKKVTAGELYADDRIDGVEVGPILKDGGNVTLRLGLPGERTVDSTTEMDITGRD